MSRLRLARRGLLPGLLASFLSGLLTSLVFPPVGWWPLAFICLLPFLATLREQPARRGAVLGFAFGLGLFGAALSWILLFGGLAWSALVMASAAAVAVFGAIAPSVWRHERPLASIVGLAALWVVIDALRAAWPIGGFTWGQLGVSQAPDPALAPLARLTGVWGVTFVVVLTNGLLLRAVERVRDAPGRGVALVLAAAALVAASALAPGSEPEAGGRPIRVAALQVDVRPFRTLPSSQEDRAVTESLARLHERLASDPPDLALWGESAIDPGSTQPAFFQRVVRGTIRSIGVPTLVGSTQPSTAGLQNQVLAFDASADVVGRYAKVHLVPYGEYVPFRRELGWVSALHQIPYDLSPGRSVHVLRVPELPAFGTPICFENSFPGIDREMVVQGAAFLAVLTNDASYETSAASAQQLEMSRLRAIEDGRWVVHSAISGISAVIDPRGRISVSRGLFDTGILRGTIRPSSERTWYVRLGDWFPKASFLVVLLLLAVPRRRRGGVAEVADVKPSPLPDHPRTLVIMPTYNERDTIEPVIEGVLAHGPNIEVLVVDDSSPDGTGDRARTMAERDRRVHVVSRPEKSGLGSAYLDGFRWGLRSPFELMVEMDSDLSHDPAELPRLIEATRCYDLTVGSRYVPGGSVTNWSKSRVLLSKAGNRYARFMLSLPVRDATSGYRVFRRPLVEALAADPLHSEGYGFQIELVYRAASLGYRVGEAPITFRERQHGVSKISRTIVAEALWLVTVWGLKLRLRPSPPANR